MKRMLPGGALILFIINEVCFVLKQFGTTGGPWFPTDPFVFCLLYRGLKHGLNPCETLPVCFVLKQFGTTGGP